MKLKFTIVAFLLQVLRTASSITIDQIIATAAKSSKQFDFLDGASQDVLVEYDIKYKMKDWLELKKMNASTESTRVKRKAIRNLRQRWTNREIPYLMAQGTFNTAERRQIQNAMDDWEMYTCIKFRKVNNNDRNRVRFQDGGGCSSFVGMIGGTQPITLGRGCRQKGTIIHEIGHAVGFQHEQTRPDRDNFVRILRENIPSNVFFNFEKYTTAVVDTYGVPYDYESVMHYGGTAFSRNGRLTIQTLDSRFQNVIGNRRGFSFLDVKLGNLMNQCAERAGCERQNCPGDGFVGKDCKCWCRSSAGPVEYCDGGQIGSGDGNGGGDGNTGGGVTQRPETGDCINMNPNCQSWANRGECANNPGYMTVFCQRACGVCDQERTCQDMNGNCQFWMEQGYCTQMFVQYMTTNCPRSCGMCRADDGENGASSFGVSVVTVTAVSMLSLWKTMSEAVHSIMTLMDAYGG